MSTAVPLAVVSHACPFHGLRLAGSALPFLLWYVFQSGCSFQNALLSQSANSNSFGPNQQFTKTHRINEIFKHKNFRRVTVTPYDVIVPMATLLGGKMLALAPDRRRYFPNLTFHHRR